MSSETKLPPTDADPSYPVAGSHSRYVLMLSLEYGRERRGDPPDSSVLDEYARPPASQAELLSGGHERLEHRFPVVPGAEELQPG